MTESIIELVYGFAFCSGFSSSLIFFVLFRMLAGWILCERMYYL